MKVQKGFITPTVVILAVVLIGAALYYSAKRPALVALTPTGSVSTSTAGQISTEGSETVLSAPLSATLTANSQSKTNFDTQLAQVADVGTAAQRFNLETFTNTDYSYAVSFPREWAASGGVGAYYITNGRSAISIASSNMVSGLTPAQFAAQDGAMNTFSTTAVNAYNAAGVISGNQSTYYIVNGSVGYKIGVTDLGDTDILRLILMTFTVTKPR